MNLAERHYEPFNQDDAEEERKNFLSVLAAFRFYRYENSLLGCIATNALQVQSRFCISLVSRYRFGFDFRSWFARCKLSFQCSNNFFSGMKKV